VSVTAIASASNTSGNAGESVTRIVSVTDTFTGEEEIPVTSTFTGPLLEAAYSLLDGATSDAQF
jgi:hypothetical protein